jgi:hypothetical protein
VAAFDGQSNCRLRWRFYDTYGYGGGVDNVQVFTTGQNNLAGQLRTSAIAYAELNNTYARSNWGYIHCWKQNAADSIGLQVEYCNNNAWALIPDGALAGNSAGYFNNASKVVTRNLTGLNTTTYDSIRVVVKMFKTPGKATVTPVLRALEVGSTSASPQAVELSMFTLRASAGSVDLVWRTESEQGCERWEIERSEDELGGYILIGTVPGRLTTNEPHEYHFTDGQPSATGKAYYRLAEVSTTGQRTYYGPLLAEGRGELSPPSFYLDKAYPNPATRSATIKYGLRQGGLTSLKVYNVLGQEVRTLVSGHQPAGYYAQSWDGRDNQGRPAANGVYLYQLISGDFSATKKLTLVR